MADEPNQNTQQNTEVDNPDALNADYVAPQESVAPDAIKKSFAERIKGLTSNFNIYLIAFLIIVFIALVIT